MTETLRRKRPSPRRASRKQPRAPKSHDSYKVRRKLPDPLSSAGCLSAENGENLALREEEQLSMPFVVRKRIEAQPFLKWAGGKTTLLRHFDEVFPGRIDRYIEPFLGGGAVFFHLKHRFPAMRALLRDRNEELINCYRAVRDRPEELMRLLDEHACGFLANREEYYYGVRKKHDLTGDLARAARVIFLNKTCYNGLWRVNARGEFNTPLGSNKNPGLYSRDNMLAASAALQEADLDARDFRTLSDEARPGDFIYLDPPYVPISAYSDFKRYTPEQFREAEQEELARMFRELHARGCRMALSNSNHPRIRQLYAPYSIKTLSAPRFINCKSDGRGAVSELIVTNFDTEKWPHPLPAAPREAEFPETKYMGSKQRLLPFILKHLAPLKFDSFLDAFSGSGCVGYAVKRSGIAVYANDFLSFCFHTARATIENNTTTLSEADVLRLSRPLSSGPTFVRDTFKGLFFDEQDCEFLDNLWGRIQELESPLQVSLALAAASRACMKKRPRGLFTFTGRKGWDGRLDLKLSMREQFLAAVDAFNRAVYSNGRRNKAFNMDVFDLPPDIADLVYIDTPYISPFSDCDYTRRYHFVEGYCHYWKGCEIMAGTSTKKIRSYDTAFATKSGAVDAFRRLFHHFRESKLVVSYSSNCVPPKEDMVKLLLEVKKDVTVHEAAHRYHHGNHAHKVGDNQNQVLEYLFVAQ